jgi:hypothetical protein
VFTRRIIVLNESFIPVGTKGIHSPYAVLWHEAVAGLKKEDIVSAFHFIFLAQTRPEFDNVVTG